MKVRLVSLCFLLFSCRTEGYEGPPSDHFDGKHFFQPDVQSHKGFLDLLRWKITGSPKDWPASVTNTAKPDIPAVVSSGEVAVTFVNHATLLIQLPGLNILTDPIWSERASPVSWAGPQRVREPGLPFDQLPKIDAVFISHNHYDHLDVPTLQRLSQVHNATVFVPLGDKVWLDKEAVNNVKEMDWGQSISLSSEITATFTPSQHWSARGLFDRNRSLWGSWLIKSGTRLIYFAGDTGYGPHFEKIQKEYGKVWLAFLPIGAYEPRWFMKDAHMNPEDAVKAYKDLGAVKALGMHYGTWQLTDEGIDDPVQDLQKALRAAEIPEDRFEAAVVGQTYRFPPD